MVIKRTLSSDLSADWSQFGQVFDEFLVKKTPDYRGMWHKFQIACDRLSNNGGGHIHLLEKSRKTRQGVVEAKVRKA